MLPLGLPFSQRQSLFPVQPVSLIPPGVSTNQVLDALILDIVAETINGFGCIDAQGQKDEVFLDLCFFLVTIPLCHKY